MRKLAMSLAISLGILFSTSCQETTPVRNTEGSPIATTRSNVSNLTPPNSIGQGRALERVTSNGRRVALVIGNSNYKDNRDYLPNPINDAKDISADLRSFGFNVTTKTNLGLEAMQEVIADFGRTASNADVALFYYAGHGVQSKGRNYLMPIDVTIASEAQLPFKSVNLNYILEEMDNAKSKVNIVMLDACRNNKFTGKFRGRGSKERGLARVDVPKGTVIVYATAAGKTADDGRRGNGLFTEGLRRAFAQGRKNKQGQIADPNLNLADVLLTASRWVEIESGGKQSPYVNGPETLKKDFYFSGSAQQEARQQVLAQNRAESARIKELEAKLAAKDAKLAEKDAKVAEERRKRLAEQRKREEAERKAQIAKEEAAERARLQATQTFSHGGVTISGNTSISESYEPEMVSIPAGSFKMGDIQGGGDSDEKPVHKVYIKAFKISKYEVTREQFRAFVNATNYKTEAERGDGCWIYNGIRWSKKKDANWRNVGFSQTDQHPVVCVSWNDGIAYAKWLSRKTGKKYRLPTEAEWEYVARAGTDTKYWWGNEIGHNRANCDGCGSRWDNKSTAPVGSFAANPWGLYDTVGNVWEWTCSKYTSPYDGSEMKCLLSGASARVFRGGSWSHYADDVRAAYRNGFEPGNQFNDVGFRACEVQVSQVR